MQILLANIDVPLNNREWLKGRFTELRTKTNEEEQLEGIREILDYTNPGPGGFYDDLGRVTAQPHLVPGRSYEEDPQYFASPLMAFGCRPGDRQSWCDYADGVWGYEVKLHYRNLDPEGRYRVRIVYAGRLRAFAYEMADRSRLGQPVTVRLTGDGTEIHPRIPKPDPVEPVEFDVPVELTRDGALTLGCTGAVGIDGPPRGCQIAEIWLMKR